MWNSLSYMLFGTSEQKSAGSSASTVNDSATAKDDAAAAAKDDATVPPTHGSQDAQLSTKEEDMGWLLVDHHVSRSSTSSVPEVQGGESALRQPDGTIFDGVLNLSSSADSDCEDPKVVTSASEFQHAAVDAFVSEFLGIEVDAFASELLRTEVDAFASELLRTQVDASASELLRTEVDASASELLHTEVDASASEFQHAEVDASASELLRTEVDASASESRHTDVATSVCELLGMEVDASASALLGTEVDASASEFQYAEVDTSAYDSDDADFDVSVSDLESEEIDICAYNCDDAEVEASVSEELEPDAVLSAMEHVKASNERMILAHVPVKSAEVDAPVSEFQDAEVDAFVSDYEDAEMEASDSEEGEADAFASAWERIKAYEDRKNLATLASFEYPYTSDSTEDNEADMSSSCSSLSVISESNVKECDPNNAWVVHSPVLSDAQLEASRLTLKKLREKLREKWMLMPPPRFTGTRVSRQLETSPYENHVIEYCSVYAALPGDCTVANIWRLHILKKRADMNSSREHPKKESRNESAADASLLLTESGEVAGRRKPQGFEEMRKTGLQQAAAARRLLNRSYIDRSNKARMAGSCGRKQISSRNRLLRPSGRKCGRLAQRAH
ncbi:hypothetical protein ACOMHN_027335 [Nucella lapillus]